MIRISLYIHVFFFVHKPINFDCFIFSNRFRLMSSEAFVTLATNDDYGLGALVLAESIRQVGTKRNLVVLISNHLSDLIR